MSIEAVVSVLVDDDLSERLRMDTYSTQDADTIEGAYISIYKRRIHKTCNSCMYDALMEMRSFYRKNKKQMEKQIRCMYRLRSGVVLSIDMGHGIENYTNANLTDEVAQYCLANYPNAMSRFDVIPSDMEQDKEEYTQKITPTSTRGMMVEQATDKHPNKWMNKWPGSR